ncbi:unnamed protein product [Clonostachys rosea f. rosea IK726]|uniref:Uncharacterized protein n=1 Tax=Clonostachys rosea f. rosea IK726 TaxID=1349383 RepID=A0ACA9U9J5_BIOOC|nr:unnamed protein product [Clonostachys rosea f. rosea IK726]
MTQGKWEMVWFLSNLLPPAPLSGMIDGYVIDSESTYRPSLAYLRADCIANAAQDMGPLKRSGSDPSWHRW